MNECECVFYLTPLFYRLFPIHVQFANHTQLITFFDLQFPIHTLQITIPKSHAIYCYFCKLHAIHCLFCNLQFPNHTIICLPCNLQFPNRMQTTIYFTFPFPNSQITICKSHNSIVYFEICKSQVHYCVRFACISQSLNEKVNIACDLNIKWKCAIC